MGYSLSVWAPLEELQKKLREVSYDRDCYRLCSRV